MEALNGHISTLGHIVLLINVFFCWIGPTLFKKQFRYFRYYLLLGLAVQIIAKILWMQSQNNLPLLHIYTVFEFIFLSLFYKSVLELSDKNKKKFNYAIWITVGFILLNSILWQPITGFNSNAKSLTQIIYIGCAVYYFFKVQSSEVERFNQLIQLFNSGILVYYAASLFIFMFSNIMMDLGDSLDVFWVINSVFYLGFQLLIFYGLWKIIFRRTKST